MKLFLKKIRKKLWIYQHATRHGMDFKRMSEKGILPKNLPKNAIAALALQFAIGAFASKAYERGEISKEDCYLELKRMESLLKETLNISWDEFRVVYRYSLGGIF